MLRRGILDPHLLNTITQGGEGGNKTTIARLRALATRTPIWGRLGQGAWQLGQPQIRKCHFLSDPCVFDLLRIGAYIDFLYIIL